MPVSRTEDQIRDIARNILDFPQTKGVRAGVGQLTTFNQLGFAGVPDKPDGWYLPRDSEVAMVLETKASTISLGKKQVDELLKNVRILRRKYSRVVGILYNGEETRVFKNEEEVETTPALQKLDYYLALFSHDAIDKEHIYELTARINNCLHFQFGIKNLYHRMIFTACALVAKRYNAHFVDDGKTAYSEFHQIILSTINKEMMKDRNQSAKMGMLGEVFSEIKMNLNVDSEDEKEQDHVKSLIQQFIRWVTEISDCINSDMWQGEDVMGIFFNEFNRYKAKSEAGQVFTPEHITDFMYRILEVNKDDKVLDATCGSGGFLVKAMANMIHEAGGVRTGKAKTIKTSQLYGIEFDREIFALACANMLIHKDGKTNLELMDTRGEPACAWIREAAGGKWYKNDIKVGGYTYSAGGVTKVMMNPPYERRYGCMNIVENVLDNVPPNTLCGFLLPDNKLEKTSRKQIKRILGNHRIRKIVKLPEDLFFGVGVTTSIFIFQSGVPQNGKEIFACYMKTDGLTTVKNKGRHDVRGLWAGIEERWVDIVLKQSGDETCQWVNPDEHLSYQKPKNAFEITEEDFRKVAMDYIMFQRRIDAKELSGHLMEAAMYQSGLDEKGENLMIATRKANGDAES